MKVGLNKECTETVDIVLKGKGEFFVTFQSQNGVQRETLQLWYVTMIDPETGWFEILKNLGTKRTDIVANIVEQVWLKR